MNITEYPTLCIVNPASANGRTRRAWKSMEQALAGRDIKLEACFTSGPNDATRLTREALHKGYRRIISVGGDGTLNEVVNGYFNGNREKICTDAVLSLIPMGTGGDFARMLQASHEVDFVHRLLSHPRERTCDLVRVTFTNWDGQEEYRHYINIADVGIGSETVVRVNRNSKFLGGFFSFLLGALHTIFTYRNRSLTVRVDDRLIYEGQAGMIVVGNGSYFGGGMKVAPHAMIDDGLLEVVVVKDLSKIQLLGNVGSIYRGHHLNHPLVEHLQGKRVEIISPDNICIEMDGETPGQGGLTFEILPAAMTLLV